MPMLLCVSSSVTEANCETMKSFCISSMNSWSQPNSTNSHKMPMVIEKQNDIMA